MVYILRYRRQEEAVIQCHAEEVMLEIQTILLRFIVGHHILPFGICLVPSHLALSPSTADELY